MPTSRDRKRRRPARRRGERKHRPDFPYTMKLPDGRTVFIEVPGRFTTDAPGYGMGFLPDGVRFLDRIRVLAMKHSPQPPSPAYIVALRDALGLTQAQLGERIGVDKLTVARWEWGKIRPSAESLAALERLRREAVRKGVVVTE